jgi:hypothetical protein
MRQWRTDDAETELAYLRSENLRLNTLVGAQAHLLAEREKQLGRLVSGEYRALAIRDLQVRIAGYQERNSVLMHTIVELRKALP